MLNADFSDCGQSSGSPSGVADQSSARIRCAISPSAERKRKLSDNDGALTEMLDACGAREAGPETIAAIDKNRSQRKCLLKKASVRPQARSAAALLYRSADVSLLKA